MYIGNVNWPPATGNLTALKLKLIKKDYSLTFLPFTNYSHINGLDKEASVRSKLEKH